MIGLHFVICEKSLNSIGETAVYMAKDGDNYAIILTGKNTAGFKAADIGDGKFRAELVHENAVVIRKHFPWTIPVKGLVKFQSVGIGERKSLSSTENINLFRNSEIFPVLAQAASREFLDEALDAATFTAFREGLKKGYGADAEHVKTKEEIEHALSLGYKMITLDCSDHVKENKTELSQGYIDKYLKEEFDIEGIPLVFTEEELTICVSLFKGAIAFVSEIYEELFKSGKHDADLEISLDNLDMVTSPLRHYFFAREILDAGVLFNAVSPRFNGAFHSGDGTEAQFEKDLEVHSAIARSLGYKLSFRVAPDKVNVLPIITRATRGNFHIKTISANWPEIIGALPKK